MKPILLFTLVFIANVIVAQDRFTTTKGIVKLNASVPFFEEIIGINRDVVCVLDSKTHELTFALMMKKFQFKKQLMRDYFNIYTNSERFTRSFFYGKIENLNIDVEKEYSINGKIEICGITNPVVTAIKLLKIGDNIALYSNFELNTDDFGVKVPDLLRSKISKKVTIEIECIFNKIHLSKQVLIVNSNDSN
jgi:hypothetical protein